MTRPGFTGCLNCLWLPTCATSYQPSCFKRCMTSRLDTRHDTHFIHTSQVGIYRIQHDGGPILQEFTHMNFEANQKKHERIHDE